MTEPKPGWPRVRFGDVVRLNKDRSADPAADGIERYVGIEHIEPEDLRIRSWGLVAEGTTFTQRIRPGQTLFVKRRAYQRKVAVAKFDAVCSGDIYVLEPKDDRLLPELLPFLCQTDAFFEHAVNTSAGSLSPRTNWTQLAQYEFALPPLAEQRRIAEVLGAISDVIESHHKAVESCQYVLRSLQKRYFIDQPEGRRVKIGDVAEVQNGTTPRREREDYWQGNVPWLPTGKVNERFIHAADEFITEKALSKCSLNLIPAGSVLIAMIGQGLTRGKAARLEIDACINQNFGAVIPKKGLDSWFLFYQLEMFYEYLRAWSHGTNQHALNCSIIREFLVWLPSIKRQREIAMECRSVDFAAQSLKKRLNHSSSLLVNLRESIWAAEGVGNYLAQR